MGAAILDLLFLHFSTHDIPIAGFYVSSQWRNDQPEFAQDIAISPFRDFGWKMPIFEGWGFDPIKL